MSDERGAFETAIRGNVKGPYFQSETCGAAAPQSFCAFLIPRSRLGFVMNANENPRNMLPAGSMAKLIGVTPQWLRDLARGGHIPKAENGQYRFVETVQGYIRFLRETTERAASTNAPENKLKAAKRQEIELRIAQREAAVIDLADADAFMAMHARIIRECVMAVPDSIPARRGALRSGFEAALQRADRRWQDARRKLIAGLDPLDD